MHRILLKGFISESGFFSFLFSLGLFRSIQFNQNKYKNKGEHRPLGVMEAKGILSILYRKNARLKKKTDMRNFFNGKLFFGNGVI